MVRKLSLYEEVAIFYIISFKIGLFGTVKYCSFPAFLIYNQLYGLCEL